VRLFSVYGPHLRKQLLWDACKKLSTGTVPLSLAGNGAELRDWLHVRDAVRILAMALDKAAPECPIFNGGTGEATDVRSIAAALCAQWGVSVPPEFSGVSRPGDPPSLVADTGKIIDNLRGEFLDWREGIKEYVRWFKITKEGVNL